MTSGKYVVLMLFRKDMFADLAQELDGSEVKLHSFAKTKRDIELADRVDFTDRDGTCYTLKARDVANDTSVTFIDRPKSFEFFNITP